MERPTSHSPLPLYAASPCCYPSFLIWSPLLLPLLPVVYNWCCILLLSLLPRGRWCRCASPHNNVAWRLFVGLYICVRDSVCIMCCRDVNIVQLFVTLPNFILLYMMPKNDWKVIKLLQIWCLFSIPAFGPIPKMLARMTFNDI